MNYRSLRTLLGRSLHYKKYLWPINAILFNLCKLYPYRDKRLWVFGAIRGEKYDDNSRFLFEYVNKQTDCGIRAVWLSSVVDVVSFVRSLGYEAYSVYSIKGLRLALSAGVAFYTHGLHDFGHFPMLGGATIVSLWHGFSFKQIYNYKYKGVTARIKKIMDRVFSWVQRDYSMVSSAYVAHQTLKEFNIKDLSTIIITGQPRNDALFYNTGCQIFIDKIEIRDRKIISFMPTYRAKGQSPNTLKDIVDKLVDNEALNLFLKQNNYLFIIKLHPSTPEFQIKDNDNFYILTYQKVESNQDLLKYTDILITDYSGVFVDYALLNRPIVFYTPDENDFYNYSEKLDEDSNKVMMLSKAYNPHELVERLKHPTSEVAKVTNEFFLDTSLKGTCFCDNVFKAILNIKCIDLL
jgi:CDP-glycerol glycerophosphotransferase